ncbi:hypothetical protein CsSME_00036891 [Camellia sinensis var. sinensis]
MNKFLKRKLIVDQIELASKKSHIDLETLPTDPGLRKKISEYHPNDQDEIRRAYLLKGPCQPRSHKFPQRDVGVVLLRFNPKWFKEFGNWLEYSIKKDAAFCLCCYLFKVDIGKQARGDTSVIGGYTPWNKKERLAIHVGDYKSAHNQAWKKCKDLMKQKQHIQEVFRKKSSQAKIDYRTRLNASVDCVRFLLRQGIQVTEEISKRFYSFLLITMRA